RNRLHPVGDQREQSPLRGQPHAQRVGQQRGPDTGHAPRARQPADRRRQQRPDSRRGRHRPAGDRGHPHVPGRGGHRGDGSPARPSVQAAPLTNGGTGGAPTYPFAATFADESAIDVATLISNSGAVRVTGPGGFTTLANYVGIDNPTNGNLRTVTYTFTPPG